MEQRTSVSPLAAFCEKCDASSTPRTLFVVAHPDDETIGAGAQLGRIADGALIVVTDGAPRTGPEREAFPSREAYAARRRAELRDALRCGGATLPVHELGITDQEATYELVALTGVLAAAMRAMQPALVVTHPYEGGHPDHDATAFAVHAAAALVARGGLPTPLIAELTSYHVRDGAIETGCFLDCSPARSVHELALDRDAAARKRAMFACYASQSDTLRWFSVDRERFRAAPVYDFTRPPHEGRLFYEHFEWGTTGASWRAKAREARHALSLGDER
jgi:LmbE family N-acetylglucosaminyl deacetylase